MFFFLKEGWLIVAILQTIIISLIEKKSSLYKVTENIQILKINVFFTKYSFWIKGRSNKQPP